MSLNKFNKITNYFVDVFTINYFNVYVSNDNNNFEKDVCEGFNTTTELTKLSRLCIWTSSLLFAKNFNFIYNKYVTLKLWINVYHTFKL